jgi:hypothetical protein
LVNSLLYPHPFNPPKSTAQPYGRSIVSDGRKLKPTTRLIWELANKGATAAEIEAATGVDKKVVIMTICRGRKNGDCKPKVKTLTTVRNQSKLTWGSMQQVKEALAVDQAQWLFDEAEKCGCKSVSEYIAELVLDAHAEAQGKSLPLTAQAPYNG